MTPMPDFRPCHRVCAQPDHGLPVCYIARMYLSARQIMIDSTIGRNTPDEWKKCPVKPLRPNITGNERQNMIQDNCRNSFSFLRLGFVWKSAVANEVSLPERSKIAKARREPSRTRLVRPPNNLVATLEEVRAVS